MYITRKPFGSARWPGYQLFVDDVHIGYVQKTIENVVDRIQGRKTAKRTAWKNGYIVASTPERCEEHLIERAKRFGKI